MATTTEVQTLKAVLNDANPGNVAAALQKVKLGTILTRVDTGAVVQGAAATFPLPGGDSALMIESIEVVASGTAGSLGWYEAAATGSTPATPAAAGKGGGIATIDADRKVLTFPNTVTSVRVIYLSEGGATATAMAATFASA